LSRSPFLIGRILKFLRCHVYTWESLYLHYEHKTIRHFDTSHSSHHEGTNHGLKSHNSRVKATMNLDLSAKTLNTQTSIPVAECDEIIDQEATSNDVQMQQISCKTSSKDRWEIHISGYLHPWGRHAGVKGVGWIFSHT
jgi:hypothetical protein